MSKLKILPSGLASDDEENCLVADSKNNRLVVFNRELQMTKVRGTTQLTNILLLNSSVLQIMTAEREHQRPQDILRVGRQVYVVYSGGEAAQPAVVRYRLQAGSQRE